RLEAALGLGLAGHALDVRRAGEAVTDTGTDGATRPGHTAADEGAGGRDGRVVYCHCVSLVPRRVSGAMGVTLVRSSASLSPRVRGLLRRWRVVLLVAPLHA